MCLNARLSISSLLLVRVSCVPFYCPRWFLYLSDPNLQSAKEEMDERHPYVDTGYAIQVVLLLVSKFSQILYPP